MKQPHIQLEELGIRYAIMPGDPGRLDAVKNFLDDVEELAYNREYRSLKGKYRGVEVLAISTGIGGSSAAIAIEELKRIGVDVFIRIGSSGALQENIRLGDLLLAEGAVRDDGTSKAYIGTEYPAVASQKLLQYASEICQKENYRHHIGIIHSHESFYIDDNARIEAAYSKAGVLGSDMETAALYTVARLRGGQALSILNNVVTYGENTEDSIGSYVEGTSLSKQGEKNEILLALKVIRRHEEDHQKSEK